MDRNFSWEGLSERSAEEERRRGGEQWKGCRSQTQQMFGCCGGLVSAAVGCETERSQCDLHPALLSSSLFTLLLLASLHLLSCSSLSSVQLLIPFISPPLFSSPLYIFCSSRPLFVYLIFSPLLFYSFSSSSSSIISPPLLFNLHFLSSFSPPFLSISSFSPFISFPFFLFSSSLPAPIFSSPPLPSFHFLSSSSPFLCSSSQIFHWRQQKS